MLTAISANFGAFWRLAEDWLARFRIQKPHHGTLGTLIAATENQGAPSSNLALGTRPDHRF